MINCRLRRARSGVRRTDASDADSDLSYCAIDGLQLWHSGSAGYLAKSIGRFETRAGGCSEPTNTTQSGRMVEIVKSISRNRPKIVLDPVEEVRHRATHFGYCIQPFAYSNASMAIRATAAATPLQKENRGDGSGITGTLLRLFAMDKELLGASVGSPSRSEWFSPLKHSLRTCLIAQRVLGSMGTSLWRTFRQTHDDQSLAMAMTWRPMAVLLVGAIIGLILWTPALPWLLKSLGFD